MARRKRKQKRKSSGELRLWHFCVIALSLFFYVMSEPEEISKYQKTVGLGEQQVLEYVQSVVSGALF